MKAGEFGTYLIAWIGYSLSVFLAFGAVFLLICLIGERRADRRPVLAGNFWRLIVMAFLVAVVTRCTVS